MTTAAALPMTVEGACTLSLAYWRLNQIAELLANTSEGPRLEHAVRDIADTLEEMALEVIDFAGRSYDPGMVPEVVEVREDQALPEGQAVIEETIEPTVTWRGKVIKTGQIIVKRSPIMLQQDAGMFE